MVVCREGRPGKLVSTDQGVTAMADSCLHTKYTQDPREKGIPYCCLMLMHS